MGAIKQKEEAAKAVAVQKHKAGDKEGAASAMRLYKAYQQQVRYPPPPPIHVHRPLQCDAHAHPLLLAEQAAAVLAGDAGKYATATAKLAQVELKEAQKRRQAVFTEVVRWRCLPAQWRAHYRVSHQANVVVVGSKRGSVRRWRTSRRAWRHSGRASQPRR